jgi:hypothetical protein
MIEIIYTLIMTNVLFIASTAYFWRKSRISKQRQESLELQEFLTDMLAGGSLVHVKRIAPADALIHVRRK